MLIAPRDFLQNIWNREKELEVVDLDYPTKEINQITDFKCSRIVHLVSFCSQKLNPDFEEKIIRAIQESLFANPDKVCLHLISSTDIQDSWTRLDKTIKKAEIPLQKVFLASVADQQYLLNTENNFKKISLGLRVLLEPVVASQNTEYESLDQYFKLEYGARYYLKYDFYNQTDWQKISEAESITQQIELIIQKQYDTNRPEIFPIYIPEQSINLNDTLWFLLPNTDSVKNSLEVIMELNYLFNMNLSIITSTSYHLPSEIELENLNQVQINSRKEYYFLA